MMDWKRESISELREYRARLCAVESLKVEIRQIDADMEHLGGMSDGVSVKSSGCAADDRIINLIVRKQKIENSLRRAVESVNSVEAGLAILTEEERHILDLFYITPAKGNVYRLCDDLCVEQASIYRKREAALRRYTIARYGCIEA